MKHTKDAQKLVADGDGDGALAILDNLLGMAPKNLEGLRLKAEILDSRGQFDESLRLMHQLSQVRGLDAVSIKVLENRAMEEKESLVFSELSSEGRWYFSFPVAQVWVSLMGFLGCAAFLVLAPQLLGEGFDRFYEMTFAFGFLVVLPWIGLISLHVFGIKKVLVGVTGLRICKRFSEKFYPWGQLAKVVVEYEKDPKEKHLKLVFYGPQSGHAPLFELDVSEKRSVIKARRHFVRNVLSYVGLVSYIAKKSRNEIQVTSKILAGGTVLVPSNTDKVSQNTDDAA